MEKELNIAAGAPSAESASKESMEQIVVVETMEQAEKRITENFERRLEEHAILPFHNPRHSIEDVEPGVRRFLEIIQREDSAMVTEDDLRLGRLEALGHDLIQKADLTDEKGEPLVMRKRHRGFGPDDKTGVGREGNEWKSAEALLSEMGRYQYPDGRKVFAVDDPAFREKIQADIAATYPEAEFSPETGLKIYQPYLTHESSLRALALATADLRGPVSSPNYEDFRRSGDAEFRELKTGIAAEIEGGIENISQERREQIVKEIIGWKKTQISFAEWQRRLFEESVENNDAIRKSPKAEEVIKALKSEYIPKMEANIEAAKKHAAEMESTLSARDDANFKQALEAIGYVT